MFVIGNFDLFTNTSNLKIEYNIEDVNRALSSAVNQRNRSGTHFQESMLMSLLTLCLNNTIAKTIVPFLNINTAAPDGVRSEQALIYHPKTTLNFVPCFQWSKEYATPYKYTKQFFAK